MCVCVEHLFDDGKKGRNRSAMRKGKDETKQLMKVMRWMGEVAMVTLPPLLSPLLPFSVAPLPLLAVSDVPTKSKDHTLLITS